MKEFPSTLHVKNKNNFKNMNYERLKCYLRRDIYEFMILRETENEYFDLHKFNIERVKNMEETQKMAIVILKELEKIGWNYKTSFGFTGIFIYSTEHPPKNCFED